MLIFLIALTPLIALILGGAMVLRRSRHDFWFAAYLAAFVVTVSTVHFLSLPHVVRTLNGKLFEPTAGMLVGEINVLVAIGGIGAIPFIYRQIARSVARRSFARALIDSGQIWLLSIFSTFTLLSFVVALVTGLSKR